MPAQTKTINAFQWLRAIGAVMIVLLHAFVTLHKVIGVDALGATRQALESGLAVALCRWVVPVFFMISGALMLDPEKEMSWPKLLKHVWRLVFVLLSFGYVFCLAEAYLGADGLSLAIFRDALDALLSRNSWDHMWFVYDLIPMYLLTPIVRPWVAQASQREMGTVLAVAAFLLLGLKAIDVNLYYNIYNGLDLPRFLVYYLLGYYAHRYLEFDVRWLALGLASLITMELGVLVFHQSWIVDPIRAILLPYALLIFLLAKRYLELPMSEYPAVALLADYSFGIYLVHPVFQHLLAALVPAAALPAFVANVLWFALPLAASLAVTWLLKQTPLFKDVL